MCSCLIMSKLFFLFRIRGKLITVSIKLWLYTLNFFLKKIIFMLTFTKLAGPPLVLGQSHILLLNLSSRWVLSRLDLWVHSWCTNERALTWKHGKHRSECYFQPHSANPNHSPFNTCLHILKKNTEWMSPVSTITLITENSFWQNAEGKNKKHEKWVTSYVSTVLLFLSVWSTAQTLKPEREVGRRLC